jgi:hypothetical protein
MRWPRRRHATSDSAVERVPIRTPDKDPARCPGHASRAMAPADQRIVDEAGVSCSAPPASIPDYLALVGDAADGYPGFRAGAPSGGGVGEVRHTRRFLTTR